MSATLLATGVQSPMEVELEDEEVQIEAALETSTHMLEKSANAVTSSPTLTPIPIYSTIVSSPTPTPIPIYSFIPPIPKFLHPLRQFKQTQIAMKCFLILQS